MQHAERTRVLLREGDGTRQYLVQIPAVLDAEQEAFIAATVERIRERGKAIDRRFADILGESAVRGVVGFADGTVPDA